jgi:hypothetical protein
MAQRVHWFGLGRLGPLINLTVFAQWNRIVKRLKQDNFTLRICGPYGNVGSGYWPNYVAHMREK